MANKAFMNSHGDRFLVHKDEVQAKDLDNEFSCCGYIKTTGEYCEAPMKASYNGKQVQYFYQAKREYPHKKDCPYARKAKTSDVSVLDTRAAKIKNTDLYFKIGTPKIPRKSGLPPTTPPPPSPGDESEEDSAFHPIRQRSRYPKTVAELVALLQELTLTDRYTDTTVSKLIVDERTVEQYRTGELPIGTPVVVLARKTNPNAYGIRVGRNQWLLVDYWAVGPNSNTPIFYLLQTDNDTRKMLYECTKQDTTAKIAVYAKWYKDPRHKNLYRSDRINRNLVDILHD